MKPRRVLHLIDTGGPGGAETVFLELVSRFAAPEWESIAVLPERDWLWEALEARGIAPVHLAGTRSLDLRYLLRLRSLARDRGVDLIQTHLIGSAVYASAAGRTLGLPQVSTFHGTVDVSPDDRHVAMRVRVLDRADNRLVFVSAALRRHFEGFARLRSAGTRVIHNGIDLDTFRPGEAAGLRAELGAGRDDLLIGAVGNVRPAKDYATLLRAVAELEPELRVRCVIVGQAGNALADELIRLRATLGLEDRVVFTGFRDDVARVLRALDVLVVSSSSEGFSLTTVQAMATGTAVVATRCGGPEEILEDGLTGLLVDAASPPALAVGIRRLAGDTGLRRRLGDAGREVAAARFSIDSMTAAYEGLYRELLAGSDA